MGTAVSVVRGFLGTRTEDVCYQETSTELLLCKYSVSLYIQCFPLVLVLTEVKSF